VVLVPSELRVGRIEVHGNVHPRQMTAAPLGMPKGDTESGLSGSSGAAKGRKPVSTGEPFHGLRLALSFELMEVGDKGPRAKGTA